MIDTNQITYPGDGPITNEFCITICTVNGSGSATANHILYRTFFHMGIPTSGKNIFPSNIKGLPTFFVIRVSEKGYTGRQPHDDIVVAMNQVSFEKDMKYLPSGGVVFYGDHLVMPEEARTDLIYYPMPIKALMKEIEVPRKLVSFMENMLFVGIVGQVLGARRSTRIDRHESLLGNPLSPKATSRPSKPATNGQQRISSKRPLYYQN